VIVIANTASLNASTRVLDTVLRCLGSAGPPIATLTYIGLAYMGIVQGVPTRGF
jgi:hypothetical protein